MAMMEGLIKKLDGEDDNDPRPYGMPGTPQNPNTGIGGGLAPFSAPPMGGGKDRGYEMPGTGSSGGVEDAPRMLAEATSRNNSLMDLGNRRSKLDLFDRSGHEGLDREESQIMGAPRSSYAGPAMPPSPMGDPGPQLDTSKWNTDGFASPGYTAKAGIPSLGSGWDEGKWNDPNHQSPKYVFGRILQEAAGGDGRLQTPQEREQAVSNILKAYPGAKFDGKQKITMPDGGVIDIFHGADAGHYGAAFQVEEGTGRDPGGNLLPPSGGAFGGGMPGMPPGGFPTGNPLLGGGQGTGLGSTYTQTIMQQLAQELGLGQALGRR